MASGEHDQVGIDTGTVEGDSRTEDSDMIAASRADDPSPISARGARAPSAAEVRADIIEVATREFSKKGLSGARTDEIAERTRTSKRMIYYYFESKAGLAGFAGRGAGSLKT